MTEANGEIPVNPAYQMHQSRVAEIADQRAQQAREAVWRRFRELVRDDDAAWTATAEAARRLRVYEGDKNTIGYIAQLETFTRLRAVCLMTHRRLQRWLARRVK